VRFRSPELELSLSTRCPLEIVDGGDVRARIALRAGETAAFVLDRVEPGEMPAPCSDADIAREFDTTVGPTGEQLGNFPQAFTHLALISAAYNLDRALG